MKKKVMKTAAVLASMIISTAAFVGCQGEHNHMDGEQHQMHDTTDTHTMSTHVEYQCPMDCEEGKTYDDAGKCPVCKIDMVEVSAE